MQEQDLREWKVEDKEVEVIKSAQAETAGWSTGHPLQPTEKYC